MITNAFHMDRKYGDIKIHISTPQIGLNNLDLRGHFLESWNYLETKCLKCLMEYMQVTHHRNMFTMLSSQVWLAGGG